MIKVECDGCKAPYQVDEKRIPPTGLKMRCPKCGTSFVVAKPGEGAVAAPGPLLAPKPPAPAAASAWKPRTKTQQFPSAGLPPPEETDLPIVGAPGPSPMEPRGAPIPAEGLFAMPLPAAPRGPPPPRGEARQGSAPALPHKATKSDFPGQRPAAGAGFGEIDLMVDLPAPDLAHDDATDIDTEDLSVTDLPLVGAAGAFGEPPPLPGRAVAGPAPRRRTAAFGAGGAPEPAAEAAMEGRRPPAMPPPRPPNRTRTAQFGEIELPPTGAAPPPRVAAELGEIDLPIVGGTAFGSGDDVDLPIADLPMAAGVGLPSPAGIGLPSPAGIGLPMSAMPGLPMMSPSGLPMSAASGLPMHAGTGLPMHAGTGLPIHAGTGLPIHAGTGLPSAAAGGVLPVPTGGSTLPAHVAGGALPVARGDAFGEEVGEELSLGYNNAGLGEGAGPSAPPPTFQAGGAIELDASTTRGVGDAVEMELGKVVPASIAPKGRSLAPGAAQPTKRGASRKSIFAVGGLLVLGGAALGFLPDYGPFGVNFAVDSLKANANATALTTLRKQVQETLDQDAASSAVEALALAKAAHEASPRYRPISAYAAFVAFERSVRFGHHSEDDALGKVLLSLAQSDGGPLVTLALAAQSADKGDLPKARDQAARVLSASASDLDGAALAGEVELRAKGKDGALAAWKRAVALRKSARTLFGLARAQLAASDAPGAEQSARAAIGLSDKHAGARILLASLIWETPAREAEALEALKKVTDDGGVAHVGASELELVQAYTLLGSIHLARSRVSAAEQAFAAALKIDPQSIHALEGNGELYYRAGRFSEALARFEAAARADDTSVPAKLGEAKTWLAQERMKEAKDLLKTLRTAHPDDNLIAYWLGRTDEAMGDKKGAEEAFTACIKAGQNRPEVVDAYVALAHLLSGLGRADDANAKLAEASSKFPDLPALHQAKGEVALQRGRYEEAKREFETALEKQDDLGTRFKLGVALRRMRAFDDATLIFDKVSSVDKDFPGLALERGLLFEEMGKSDKALEMYAAALKKAPNDVDLKLRVGSTEVMAGDAAGGTALITQAEPMLRAVLKDRPNSAEANHFLGRAMLSRNSSPTEAMRFLQRAAELDPNRAEYHLYIGWAANETGQPALAETELRKALDLDHELGDAYWQEGVLKQKQGATLDALADLQLALAKRPSRYQAYASMALCYEDQTRWPDAEAAWRRAIAGNDGIADWHYQLGRLLAQHGNVGGATPELERAVALAEGPDAAKAPWLFDAHFRLGDALRATNREKAIEHYQRFLEMAPTGNAYRTDAVAALKSLGVTRNLH